MVPKIVIAIGWLVYSAAVIYKERNDSHKSVWSAVGVINSTIWLCS